MKMRLVAYCTKCGKLAKFQVEKEEQKIIGYYEDEDGNLQMKVEKNIIKANACDNCIDTHYLVRDYVIVGKYVQT